MNRHFPWYGSYLLLCHFFSLSIISTILTMKHGLKAGIVITVVIVFAVEIYTICNLQFTTTAFMLAAAGGLLASAWLESPGSYKSPYFGTAILLLVASSMVRFQMFCLSMVLIALALVPSLLFVPKKSDRIIRASVLFGFSLLLSYALVCINNGYYAVDSGWKDFYRNCATNGLIRDYARPANTDQARKALRKVGWSDNDLRAQRDFLNWDEKIFSAENTEYVATRLPAFRSDLNAISVFQSLITCLRDPLIWPLFPAIIFFLLLRRRDLPLAYYSSVLFAAVATAALMIVFLKLPARIYTCIAEFLLLTFAFTIDASKLKVRKSDGNILGAWLGIVSCLILSVPYLALSANLPRIRSLKRYNKELKQTLKTLQPREDQLYIVWGASFPYEAIKPLDDLTVLFENFNLLSLSCQNGTPLISEQLKRFQVKDPFEGLVRRNNEIFLIASPVYPFDVLTNYYLEHYGINVVFERLMVSNKSRISLLRAKQAGGRPQ